ncbi:hypothetical protein CQ022_08890 [Chryseobacterium culicis]|uniref:Uncharacterized protein n=2 Tax=Chryseobacterium culicis TaxID=680127 RepID=A0A2S9D0Q5_CHRCI|nr:hypothetical protein CQ022_08890 [Chryseobacterium culicis]PRB92101.1 hypothetical protein CQ033_02560 [Chryseobacterium culicis]
MENNIYMIELLQQHKDLISTNLKHYKDDFIFESEMEKLINIVCEDKEAFNFYSLNYHEALKEGRAGNIQKAEMLIVRAKKYIDFDSLQSKEKDLYGLISLPIHAFLSYKRSNYTLAKQQTHETMLFDEKLEQYNPSMFYHKIQQLHNVSRVEMKENNNENAVGIFNLLYRSLLLSEEVHYLDIKFSYQDSSESLKKLRKLMLAQVTNEYIPFLDRLDNRAEILYQTFSEVLNNQTAVDDELMSFVYWVKLKWNSINQEEWNKDLIKNFIRSSTDFTSSIPIDSLLEDAGKEKPQLM